MKILNINLMERKISYEEDGDFWVFDELRNGNFVAYM